MRTHFVLLAAMTATVFLGTASADCIDGPRPATGGEANYFNQVYASLKGALPAAPAGWTLAPVQDEHVQKFFCEGDREGDFEVRVRASYTYHMPKQEGDRIYAEYRDIERQKDKLRELPPDVSKERQVWLDKMSVANRASNKAEKEGDKKLARQLDNEAEGYSKKGHEIRDKYIASIEPQITQLEAKQKTLNYSDTTVNVRIIANEHDANPLNQKTASDLTFGKTQAGKTGLKVQSVRVIAEGRAPQRDEIMKTIDRDKLARLAQ